MTNTELTVIDQSTGEVLSRSDVAIGTNEFLNLLDKIGMGDRSLLLHDAALIMCISEEDRLDVVDAYSVAPQKFGKAVGKCLPVVGATIYEFEAGEKKDKSWHDRYFQARILVQDGDQLLLIKSSGQWLLRHVAQMCTKYGWYIFRDGPIEYTFEYEGPGEPHYMNRKDKQIKRIIPKSQRGKENVSK